MTAELLLDYLTPESLGLDSKRFPEFRDVQLEAIERAVYSDKRFVGLALPTGSGKSLVAAAIALMSGKRTVILTHTKALMDQYLADKFPSMVDIRGKDNYQCGELESGSCRDGAEVGCGLMRGNGCTYEVQKSLAIESPVVVSNYTYWLTINDKGAGLNGSDDLLGETSGKIEQLILDEGHYGPAAVSDYLGFRLMEKEISRYMDPLTMTDSISQWASQAVLVKEDLKAETRALRMELAHHRQQGNVTLVRKLLDAIKHAEQLYLKVHKLSTATSDEWVCEKSEGTKFGRQWQFDVIWPGRYAEQYLFCGVEKVILMSATLRPKTMGLLGVGRDDYEFFEWGRVFPAQRNPMYFCPPIKEGKPVRISRSTSDEDLKLWVEHMDKLIDQFIDRRVVVLTSSYAYQKFIMENSRHAIHMAGNTSDPSSDSAMEVFEKFIKTPPPIVLCSPSFGTGWDFKGDRAELLIISKVPLRPPPTASKLMAARLERDKEWASYETMQDVVQWAGRGMRSMSDRCTVVWADGAWGWFGMRSKHLAPKGFVQGIRRVNKITPMERLKKGE